MRFFNETLEFNTKNRFEIRNITDDIIECVEKSNIKEGICLVYPLHTTCGIFINDIDNRLIQDIHEFLEELVPQNRNYKHNDSNEANADGHIRQLLAGHTITLPINDGKLFLGTWQTVYYAEYDGMRPKEVLVKIIGE